jgi:hypothetical protein
MLFKNFGDVSKQNIKVKSISLNKLDKKEPKI